MLKNNNSISQLKDMSSLMKSNGSNPYKVVPISKVKSKPQVRKEFTNLDELADSIKSVGLQQPIIVSEANIQGDYVIQKGERRWRACKEAGLSEIAVIIQKAPKDQISEIAGELIENIQRENLLISEIADGILLLANTGMNGREIATKIGKKEKYVSLHLNVARSPEYVKELYTANLCNDLNTISLFNQLNKLDPHRCESFCKIALSEKLPVSRATLKDMIDKLSYKTSGDEEAHQDKQKSEEGRGEATTKVDAETVKNPEPEPQPESKKTVETKKDSSAANKSTELSSEWRKPIGKTSIYVRYVEDTADTYAFIVEDRVPVEKGYLFVRIADESNSRHGKIIKVKNDDVELLGIQDEQV